MAVSVDLAEVLDRQWEDKPLQATPAAPVTALAGVSDADAEHIRAVQAASRPGSRRLDEHAVLSTVMRHEEGFYASTDTRGVSECVRESERSCSPTPGARRDDEAPSDPKA